MIATGRSLSVLAAVAAGSCAAVAFAASCIGGGCATPVTPALQASQPLSPKGIAVPTREDIILVGAGDIASCDNDHDEQTAALVERLLAAASPASRAFTAGDNAYPSGSRESFRACYLPTWGRFLQDTLPVSGNHDWQTPGAEGYFATFGPRAGDARAPWRSVEVGTWHVVLLDSNCDEVGGCNEGSPQHTWLKADLAASRARCTVAIWHHPLASSGRHGPDPRTHDLWRTLEAAGADFVLAGHDHHYERFGPLHADLKTADGGGGVRSFVVGTGGRSSYPLRAFPLDGSVVRHTGIDGVLMLFLDDGAARWRFITTTGETLDEGSAPCR